VQRGKHIDKWCPSQKIFSNVKFICNYIESKASNAGVDTSDVSSDNIRKMFKAAVKELIIRANEIKEWTNLNGKLWYTGLERK
jgi:hypothetical protein